MDWGSGARRREPEWHDLFTRVYQIALDLGDPGSRYAPSG